MNVVVRSVDFNASLQKGSSISKEWHKRSVPCEAEAAAGELVKLLNFTEFLCSISIS